MRRAAGATKDAWCFKMNPAFFSQELEAFGSEVWIILLLATCFLVFPAYFAISRFMETRYATPFKFFGSLVIANGGDAALPKLFMLPVITIAVACAIIGMQIPLGVMVVFSLTVSWCIASLLYLSRRPKVSNEDQERGNASRKS